MVACVGGLLWTRVGSTASDSRWRQRGRRDSPGSTAHGRRGRAENSCRMRKLIAVKKVDSLVVVVVVRGMRSSPQNQRVVAAVPSPVRRSSLLLIELGTHRFLPQCTDIFDITEPHFSICGNLLQRAMILY